jgi:hypothetical protein
MTKKKCKWQTSWQFLKRRDTLKRPDKNCQIIGVRTFEYVVYFFWQEKHDIGQTGV